MLLPSPPAASDPHTYSFHLKPGWLLRLSVEQRGTDVVARVLAPDGRELFRVDSPTGGEGTEEVWIVAEIPGVYRVQVGPQGRHRARVVARRPATEEERINAAGERAFHLAFQKERGAPRAWLERRYLAAACAWATLGRKGREADAWFRLGQIRAEAGDWAGALEAQRRARNLYQAAGAHGMEGLALDRIADAWQGLGELDKARQVLHESLRRWQGLKDTWNVAATSYRLCQVAHLAGRAWDALECYEQVRREWRRLGYPVEEGTVRVDMGTLYASLGDLERALESYREALALLPERCPTRGAALTQLGNTLLRAGLSRRALLQYEKALASGGQASALSGMALAWQRLGRPDLALPLFERALSQFHQPSEKATVWSNIGHLHLSQGRMQAAAAAFKKALSFKDRASRAEALSGLARVARRQGDWTAARSQIEEALGIVESLRADMDSSPDRDHFFLLDLLKATYLASKRDDYDFLIDLLMERGQDLQALEVHERALARSLADRLGSAPMPPIESLLDEETALLEYSLGEERSYLWWITRTGRASFELPGRRDLEPVIRSHHRLISRRQTTRFQIDHSSRKIFRLLLEPVASRLSHRRLVIVAPDLLQYVPFETLLLDRHEVLRSPSATVLARLKEPEDRSHRGLALVGNPVFSRFDRRLPSYMRAPERAGEPRRLPYLDREIRSILTKAGSGRVLEATGFNAVREVVTGGTLSGFSILHFTGHGRPDGLLLTRFDPRGRLRPGWLTAEDIRKLHLEADLVVLSACQTALGREVRGEGLVGLSHSFLAAGASSVLGSLWSVDDQATAALMDRFYRELLVHGRPPAEALRLAQLSMKREKRWRSPYYWGGFVLQGDGTQQCPLQRVSIK